MAWYWADSMALRFVFLFIGSQSILCGSLREDDVSVLRRAESLVVDALWDIVDDNIVGHHPTSDYALLAGLLNGNKLSTFCLVCAVSLGLTASDSRRRSVFPAGSSAQRRIRVPCYLPRPLPPLLPAYDCRAGHIRAKFPGDTQPPIFRGVSARGTDGRGLDRGARYRAVNAGRSDCVRLNDGKGGDGYANFPVMNRSRDDDFRGLSCRLARSTEPPMLFAAKRWRTVRASRARHCIGFLQVVCREVCQSDCTAVVRLQRTCSATATPAPASVPFSSAARRPSSPSSFCCVACRSRSARRRPARMRLARSARFAPCRIRASRSLSRRAGIRSMRIRSGWCCSV